ncbi:hypothetical protein AXA44_37100 [Rhodococcus sp. SC4]|nr:hypothetical protein AXA44_37100 [Rhodococcus sp. SC4]
MLEAGLGLRLVDRSTRYVRVTSVGRRLLAQATHVLDAANEFVEIAADPESSPVGTMRLGMVPTVAPFLLPSLSPVVAQTFPGLTLDVLEHSGTALVELIANGRLDAAILEVPTRLKGLVEIPLYIEEFVLAAPIGDPILDSVDGEGAASLGGPPFVLFDGDDFGTHLRSIPVLSACLRTRATTRDAPCSMGSLATVLKCVVGGIARTVLPESLVATEAADSVLGTLRFSSPAPVRRIGLVHAGMSRRTDLCHELADLVGEAIRGEKSMRTFQPIDIGAATRPR